jgi:hypothetical protein
MPNILISDITVTSKTQGHEVVLRAESGTLVEENGVPMIIFVNYAGAVEESGGPVPDNFYKARYNIAGEFESARRIRFQGRSDTFQRYVFIA